MPNPFANIHDLLIKRYLETGYQKFIDQSRKVVGLHKTGYLIALSLLLRQVSDESGSTAFFGVIRRCSEVPNEHYMVLSENLELLHISSGRQTSRCWLFTGMSATGT